MAEREKDKFGSTGDGLGEASSGKVGERKEATQGGAAPKASDVNSTESSEGTIASGTGDSDMTQASGGSVD